MHTLCARGSLQHIFVALYGSGILQHIFIAFSVRGILQQNFASRKKNFTGQLYGAFLVIT